MIELHADYDHNGRIAARGERPTRGGLGAIVASNLDADGRSLPGDASVASSLILDWTRSSKSARDDELLRFEVRMPSLPLPAGASAELRVPLDLGSDVQIYDSRRQRLAARASLNASVYTIAPAASTELFIEVGSLAFSPKGTNASGTLLGNDFFITAAVVDAAGTDLATDQGSFRIAPLVLVGDVGRAERVYMASVPENEPSIVDVRVVLAGVGVPFVPVLRATNNGDTWLQDQFQLGYVQAPGNTVRTILHLPRMRSDSVSRPGTLNLSGFIDNHFPSTDCGVFQDFWTRTLDAIDVTGNTVRVPIREAEHMRFQIERAYRLRRWILEVLRRHDESIAIRESLAVRTFFDIRSNLARLRSLADDALAARERAATTDEERTARAALRAALNQAARELETAVPASPSAVTLVAPSVSAELQRVICNRFERDLEDKLSSLNYGGNIEVSPPVGAATFGKIVVGSLSFRNQRNMDPSLEQFLEEQRVQPLVRVNTAWLDVGHVDEILTFVPAPDYGSGSAILRASPAIALDLLRAARNLFLDGISSALHTTFDPGLTPGYYPRRTDIGRHPVTRMLRGKTWLHRHEEGPAAPTPILPPRIYLRMVEHWRFSLFNDMRYTPGPGADRHYAAAINVFEFLEFEGATNRCIEDVLLAARPVTPDAVSGGTAPPDTAEDEVALAFSECAVGEGLPEEERTEFQRFLDGARLENILRREFPELPILGLPVLFDRFDDWMDETTIAFLPDAVNLQQSERHVLVPRPYGPRMGVDDAITVLDTVMRQRLDSSFLRNLNARALARRGLDQTWHWHDGGNDAASRVRVREVAELFRDGFVEDGRAVGIEEIARRITTHRRNGGHIAGEYLRGGWQKIYIPEQKVDLFEAYIQLVLERLGLTVHWVDSWYYHLHSGGVHCATNALRPVGAPRRAAWWTVPDAATVADGE